MSIYIADLNDPFVQSLKNYPMPDIPDDAKLSNWSTTGYQWNVAEQGPMQDHHRQTWKGDDRTIAQKEAAEKHSKEWHSFGKTPTPKGGKLTEAHKQALRVPRPGAGLHGKHCRGDNHPGKIKVTCPHCDKQGGLNVMKRWHFDNCKTLYK